MKNLLLISSSKYQQTDYLVHCRDWVVNFLASFHVKKIAFIPYAAVSYTYESYEKTVQSVFASLNCDIISLHRDNDPKKIIEQADAIAVGGGNTFQLLNKIYQQDLLNLIQQKVEQGTPYFGWSAGANVACKTIMTTNDMPIVYPPSFIALDLFPYQINAHFISGTLNGHNGESREERFAEFLQVNSLAKIFALPEGTALQIHGEQVEVIGHSAISLFEKGKTMEQLPPLSRFLI